MRWLLSLCVAFITPLVWVGGADAATTITLSPTSGAPGTSIVVSGSGFDASASVDVFLGTADLALVTTSATGTVSASIQIPASAQPGTNWITLDERRTHAAAQASFYVSAIWAQGGFGPSWRGDNPFENTIDTGNVDELSESWGQQLDGLGNGKYPIFYAGNVFVEDLNKTVRAFSQAGKLLWTATAPGASFVTPLPAVGASSKVVFADAQGNITAYNAQCRTDGGVCAPAWTKNIGVAVTAAPSTKSSLLYVPAADGLVHVLNASTGAAGTSIGGGSSGAVTAPVSFSPNGKPWIVQGDYEFNGQFGFFPSSALSGVAVVADSLGFATEANGRLDSIGGSGWSTTLGGTGCTPPRPVYADSVVYAAGCTSLGAYDAGTGAALWTIATSGPAAGLAVANGVLYACVGQALSAYAASYGGRLWSGDYCAAPPVVVNGVLYSAASDLEAFSLTGARTAAVSHRGRPDPRHLRPTIRAPRSHGRVTAHSPR
ncbi:PQQ-binding-like beta-propeller repeat protein [Baekduia sp.]|jgi:hypothetical protein|uniref:outer membrane protein assembly factor BamB family protein n=1 Tax=Baekduia sp. TaxID=2600305 RepID=UPI002DFD6D32|nr:PQQ-binding-like beta-propeller repeat protein [Baekduia sp.]